MKIYYFDNAATTQIDDQVLDAMEPFFASNYGNASSLYKLGKISKDAIETSRQTVANILSCKSEEIYFTSRRK